MNSFNLISSTGEVVELPCVNREVIFSQSAWLHAALDIGEESGIIPVASTRALHCLVKYMQHRAAHLIQLQEEEIEKEENCLTVPIACTCDVSREGLGYDVRALLPSSDVIFLDSYFADTNDSSDNNNNNNNNNNNYWTLSGQELLLELLVTADFVGHRHLAKACIIYFCCRLMSSSETEVLGWFPERQERSGEEKEIVLCDEERLHVLREMKKIIELED